MDSGFMLPASKWEKRHMSEAQHWAEYSKDPSTKVGCIAVDSMNTPVAMGFNGIARNVADHPERLERPHKIKWILHAEMNMIANAARQGRSLLGSTAYVTLYPCSVCAGMMINAGVKAVKVAAPSAEEQELYNRWAEDFAVSSQMFKEAGITIDFIK